MKETAVNSSKIRIEKIERLVLPKSFSQFCNECYVERIFISIEQANSIFGLTSREIFRLAEANIIHFVEDSKGLMFVCANSIADLQKETLIIQKGIKQGEKNVFKKSY